MATFTLVTASDWTGLYIDGELAIEGHSIDAFDALDWAKDRGPVTKLEMLEANNAWLEDLGNLPGQLRCVRFAAE